MRRSRRVTGGLLVAGAVLLALPGVAGADAKASTVDGPAAGPYQADTALTLSATVQRSVVDDRSPVSLVLRDPAGREETVASRRDSGPLTRAWRTTCAYDLGACDADPGRFSVARNGTWILRLVGNGASASRTFTVAVPPAAPREVTAAARDGSSATVRWHAGTEPDLVGYEVIDESGAVIGGRLGPNVCGDGGCAVDVPLPAGDHTLAVQAVRSTCPDCAETLTSAPSERVTVRIDGPAGSAAPPSAEPADGAPGPSGGGGGGGGDAAGGLVGGGLFGGSFNEAQQRARAEALAALAQGQPRAGSSESGRAGLEASGTIEPDGTYEEVLPYGEQLAAEDGEPARGGPVGKIVESVTDVVSSRGVVNGLGAALVLSLVAVHLRLWVLRTRLRTF